MKNLLTRLLRLIDVDKSVASVMNDFNRAAADLKEIAQRESAKRDSLKERAEELLNQAQTHNEERARAEVLAKRMSDFASV